MPVLLLSGELPQKVFSRHQRLSYAEITSYQCDETERWCALTGLTPQVLIMVDDEDDVPIFFIAHARNGRISTSGLKSDVTIMFLDPDLL